MSREDASDLVRPLAGEKKEDPQMNSKWANQRLEELLGYGKYQYFQVWVFLGLLSFIGAMNFCHLMLLVTKSEHRCALPTSLEHK